MWKGSIKLRDIRITSLTHDKILNPPPPKKKKKTFKNDKSKPCINEMQPFFVELSLV